ncbi:MAG: lytic transglycosylase domain-containing protein [Burkholderiaceae bacterium]|jgi:soluble lytic murein transglycosylase|nr:lytic transglycosylase domain-containing protein [Burkholderiaceae bacterium]
MSCRTAALCVGLLCVAAAPGASAQANRATAAAPAATVSVGAGDRIVLDAREALRRRDARQLADAKRAIEPLRHPLAPWVDYWELTQRLREVTPDEVEAFYARWSGTYVEDRLRNDWLLELGKRRQWDAFQADVPRFRMNDDREVTCYAALADHLDGRDVGARAREAWFAQRDADDGCHLLARTLLAAGVFTSADVAAKTRLAVERNQPRAARQALELADVASVPAGWWDQPERALDRAPAGRRADLLDALALGRLAAADPDRAAQRLDDGLAARLGPDASLWAWGQTARWSALRLQPQAVERYERLPAMIARAPGAPALADDVWAWQVRAALRAEPTRWDLVRAGVDAMGEATRADPTWVYWGARADLALAPAGDAGRAPRERAQQALASIAGPMHFYGKLAAEELGRPQALPPRPPQLTAGEREAARRNAGLARALHAIDLGLRSEGVREWNFTLRGMDDRQLLAAAQLACDREVWDRCIATSERTQGLVDVAQRFPTPFRDTVVGQSQGAGIDPALVYGLIRQESRFVLDARSHVGASGLMQLMPDTARWTARKVGVPLRAGQVTDLETNLKLGASYLRLVLDDFGGSPALATAAYNAGPGRPRRWREGPVLEPAAWAEAIPFGETRDYVKKVLSNAVVYSALLADAPLALRPRLGPPIGPRADGEPAANQELP